MKGKQKNVNSACHRVILMIFFGLALNFLVPGCTDDDQKDDEGNSYLSGPCSSIYEPKVELDLHDFEVSGLEDCATAGIDIEINALNYSEGRTLFIGSGTYYSETGPHYMLSWDKNKNLCYIELESGEFEFVNFSSWCTGGLTEYIYTKIPKSNLLDDAVCWFSVLTTAEGLEDCESAPD